MRHEIKLEDKEESLELLEALDTKGEKEFINAVNDKYRTKKNTESNK